MAELIDYVRTLAEEIGPRPATSDSEHRAAEWLATTFGSYGLETETHEFDAPRTYGWAYALYHLLTLLSAFAAGFKPYLVWPAFALSAIVAFFLWSDLDTRWGLSRLMPKGASQNVIARHVPRSRRGERLRRIVIVAHYDSARASLAFAPGMVGNFPTTFALLKWCTFLTPVFILLMALPFTATLDPWIWYVTMAVSAYLLVPLVINVHREIAMPFVAGANDNASGVAAMLGVMEKLVPAPDAQSLVTTGSFPSVRRGPVEAEKADVVPEGSLLRYTPAGGQPDGAAPDDFEWADEGRAEKYSSARAGHSRVRHHRLRSVPQTQTADTVPMGSKVEGLDDVEPPATEAGSGRRARARPGLLGKLGRKKERHSEEEVTGWLGVERGLRRSAGRSRIGSWDNFGDDDDDAGGLGWKGGWAGDDPIGDPEFAAHEAARIRRKVTEDIDRELTEKEIWFVATGAEEVGTVGMQALLRDYADDLKTRSSSTSTTAGPGSFRGRALRAWRAATGPTKGSWDWHAAFRARPRP